MLDLDFDLKPSVYFVIFFSCLLCLALGVLFSLHCYFIGKILAIIFTLVYGSFVLGQYGLLQGSAAIIAIRRLVDGRWLLSSEHQSYEAKLCGESTVTNMVSVLLFRVDKKITPKVCIVFKDSLSPDQYRKLMVTLTMLS